MPIPVAGRGQRVDGIDLVAAAHQGIHQQAMVGLHPHHHLTRIAGELRDRLLQFGQALHPVRDAEAAQPLARRRHHLHLVLLLRPVNADEDHPTPPCGDSLTEPGEGRTPQYGVLGGTTSSAVLFLSSREAGARFPASACMARGIGSAHPPPARLAHIVGLRHVLRGGEGVSQPSISPKSDRCRRGFTAPTPGGSAP